MLTGMIEDEYGIKIWYKEDIFHRVDGPAVEDEYGTKLWYQDGELHRLDGPAVEMSNGDKTWANKDCPFNVLINVRSGEVHIGKHSKSSIEAWDEWFSGTENLPRYPRGSKEFKALEDLWKQFKAQVGE